MYTRNDIELLLKENNIEYKLVEHEAVFTMQDIENINLGENGVEVKNLFLRDDKGVNHYLIVAREDTKIDMKGLKDIIHSTRLSFASEERLLKYLGVTKGCVSPFGILNDSNLDVKVFIDSKLKDEKIIGAHPNENTATIFLATKDLEKIIKNHGNSLEYINI